MGTIPTPFVNEAFRRIDKVAGGLNDRTGVMVIVQNIFLLAGSIE